MPARFCVLMVALMAVIAPAIAGDEWPTTLTIDNPGTALGQRTVVVEVDKKFRAGHYKIDLGKRQIAAEIGSEDGKNYLYFVLPAVAPGKSSFEIGWSHGNPIERAIWIDQTRDHNIKISVIGKLSITLRTDLGPKPILYPLLGPNDVPYTRDFPMKDVTGEDKDHPHHRSFWFTHGKVNGVDFWTEGKGHGSIKQTAILSKDQSLVAGTVRTSDDWLDADGKKVCEDERLIRVYATDGPGIFDFEVTIKATNGPVTFGDTKEGMFGMRLASSMDVTKKTGGKIVNAEGITDTAAWGKASPWVDYSGPIDGKTVGVAIFDHPTSFRHPTTWHVRDYGLFAANPFGWKDFDKKNKSGDHTIPAGESITFKYRILLHEGDAKSAGIAEAYRAYATPLKVEVR